MINFEFKFKWVQRDNKLKLKWEELQNQISEKFGGGEKMDIDSITYLIGVQELGKGFQKFKKDESFLHYS